VSNVPNHTVGHVDCAACDLNRTPDFVSEMANMLFPIAAQVWFNAHAAYVSARTRHDYEQYIAALSKFFASLPLNKITIGTIREYHKQRLLPAGVKKAPGKAGALRVRMECSTLRQIMEEAGCWKAIKPFYKHPPLSRREKEGSGQSFTAEEEEIVIRIGMELPRCELAAHCLQVMFRSGMGFGELAHVARRDFDVEHRAVQVVEGAKNDNRHRLVPLNQTAFASMMWILKRWEAEGGSRPDEFLLYHRGPDFSRPMVSIQNAYNRIEREAIKRKLLPVGFHRRIYDCRVTAVTRGLSSGKMSAHTAKKVFGHFGKKIQERYYKPDIEILRDAMEVLDAPKKPPRPEIVETVQKVKKPLTG
jgi:integrase